MAPRNQALAWRLCVATGMLFAEALRCCHCELSSVGFVPLLPSPCVVCIALIVLNRKNLNYTSILPPNFIPLPQSTSVYKQTLHCLMQILRQPQPNANNEICHDASSALEQPKAVPRQRDVAKAWAPKRRRVQD